MISSRAGVFLSTLPLAIMFVRALNIASSRLDLGRARARERAAQNRESQDRRSFVNYRAVDSLNSYVILYGVYIARARVSYVISRVIYIICKGRECEVITHFITG